MARGRIPPIPPNRLPPVFEETHHRQLQDDFTLRALRHQAKQSPPAQLVYPITLRNHPMWSGNNELGRAVEFAPDANNTQMIVKLGEWGEPEVLSISLGIAYPDSGFDPLEQFGFRVTGLVTIGVGGATQEIEVDWVQGTTFTVVANAVNVTARYEYADAVPSGLVLSALISRGKVAGKAPTRTFELANSILAGNESSPIRIPNFARSVMMYDRFGIAPTTGAFSANARLRLQRNPNPSTTTVLVIRGDDLIKFAANGLPIPDGARYFVVESLIGGTELQPGVIFQLGL